jgi:2,5-diketo-D-gluconate reductase A
MMKATSALVAVANAKIPTIRLGNSHVHAPMVITGTFQLNETEAYDAVKAASDVGFTGAHCDWTYFNMPGCGKALAEAGVNKGFKRLEFYLQASVGGYGYWWDHFPENSTAAEGTRIQIEQTFEELGVDYVDHMFLHMPPQSILSYQSCAKADAAGEKSRQETIDQWRVMEEYYFKGKIRSLGVSNFCPDCFDFLENARVKPVLNQLSQHVGWGTDPLGVWTDNANRGVQVQAYSPLGHGSELDPEVLHGNQTTKVAAAHNRSTAEVALKWLVANDIPLVVQSSNPKHLASDIDLWSWDFTEDEKKELDQPFSETPPAPAWCCSSWDVTSAVTV